MSIYGNAFNSNSEISNYIENNFLESCLSEEAIKISNKISSYSPQLENRFEFMQEVSCDIFNSYLSENTKNILLDKLYSQIKYISEDSYLLEYKGNEQKNKEFIDILKEVEEWCAFNVEKISKLSKYLEEILKLARDTKKNPKKFKDSNEKIRKMIDEYNNWYNTAGKNINANVTTGKLRKSIKSFNTKYSEITNEEKKKLSKKLDEFRSEIFKLIDPWFSSKNGNGGKSGNELEDLCKQLKEIDADRGKVFASYTYDLFDILFEEQKYTYGDISYVYMALDLGRENTIIYKFINKVFK